MNNFGVIELASAKTTSAPGWAYVPDTRPGPHHHHHAHVNPHAPTAATTNRKRARNTGGGGGGNLSLADANARQEAKARREIEILDRDNARDVQIAVPTRPRPSNRAAASGNTEKKRKAEAAAAALAARKHGSNVRRILQSQKTFGNYLDDYIALAAQQQDGAATASNNNNNNNNNAGGLHVNDTSTSTPLAKSTTNKKTTAGKSQQQGEDDMEMPDAPPRSRYLTPNPHPPPPAHKEDSNPLLSSRLPPIPSDSEMAALLAAPPLSYLEARGSLQNNTNKSGSSYPARAFCAVCGYWGRVRCMKCGTRVCALDCLETHREECVTRYGI